ALPRIDRGEGDEALRITAAHPRHPVVGHRRSPRCRLGVPRQQHAAHTFVVSRHLVNGAYRYVESKVVAEIVHVRADGTLQVLGRRRMDVAVDRRAHVALELTAGSHQREGCGVSRRSGILSLSVAGTREDLAVAAFTSVDGTRLYYEEEGTGTPVVLLHGLSSSTKGNWQDPGIWTALVDAGKRVIGLDARGHGRS